MEFIPIVINTALIIVAYLFGSFTSAVVVCRILGLPDPRSQGSGNPGATNVLRHGGKKAAILTLLLDMFKGLLPVLLARVFTDDAWILGTTGLAAFLGHLFPLFFNFKGGKGVATGFGVFLAWAWPMALAVLAVWLTMAALFRYSSLAALTAATLAPVFMWLLHGSWVLTVCSGILAIILIGRHHSNIRNLLSGKEDKIGQK